MHYKGNIISLPELGKIFPVITTVFPLTIDLIKNYDTVPLENGQDKSATSLSFTAASQEVITKSEKSVNKYRSL